MPRLPRQENEAGIHHVYARGVGSEVIFRDAVDRLTYLRLLEDAVVRMRWRCLGYCLMSNHVHLLVETREPNLGRGMHGLHGDYARIFNARYARTGHLFGSRFGSRWIRDDRQLAVVVGYIAANPVEAGLCGRAEEWEWGSHGAVVLATAPAWVDVPRLYQLLGAWGPEPRRAYAQLVRDRVERYFGGSEAA